MCLRYTAANLCVFAPAGPATPLQVAAAEEEHPDGPTPPLREPGLPTAAPAPSPPTLSLPGSTHGQGQEGGSDSRGGRGEHARGRAALGTVTEGDEKVVVSPTAVTLSAANTGRVADTPATAGSGGGSGGIASGGGSAGDGKDALGLGLTSGETASVSRALPLVTVTAASEQGRHNVPHQGQADTRPQHESKGGVEKGLKVDDDDEASDDAYVVRENEFVEETPLDV